ncbi:hypothetical protein Pan54_42160 [Rubinisphaera italica]|uniref:Uncharacterized protein n=2 Tax=Rubinisphaera italica TaxID=2527969 RepID=A0A5C5XM50_9PLAN|nr:hypothetical protein Pan54_42160 [Rubinisphaera italica]
MRSEPEMKLRTAQPVQLHEPKAEAWGIHEMKNPLWLPPVFAMNSRITPQNLFMLRAIIEPDHVLFTGEMR